MVFVVTAFLLFDAIDVIFVVIVTVAFDGVLFALL